jgi:hypothetical protein
MAGRLLSLEDVSYLLANLAVPPPIGRALKAISVDVRLVLTDAQVDDLRDLVADRLDVVGFDEDYAANAEGKFLEELIDKLYLG